MPTTGKRQLPPQNSRSGGGRKGGARKIERTRKTKRGIALTSLGFLVLLAVLWWKLPQMRPDVQSSETNTVTAEQKNASPKSSETPATESLPPATETPQPEETIPPDGEVSLFFAGDILLDYHVDANYDAMGINGILSESLVEKMNSADICMVNQEFPFTTVDTKYPGKQFNFKVDPSYVSAFQDMGVDIATLANNHILDYYYQGAKDSIETLTNAGIKYSGVGCSLEEAGKLDLFEVNGITVGVLSASRVFPDMGWNIGYTGIDVECGCLSGYPDDVDYLVNLIQEADSQCDFLVLYIHWGKEKKEWPEAYERENGKQYIDAGVDLLIGSHSHCPQGVEYYNGVPIFYSMGNYIFNSANTNIIGLEVTVDASLTPTCRLVACYSANGKTVEKPEGDAQALYQYIQSISYDGVTVDDTGLVSPPTT